MIEVNKSELAAMKHVPSKYPKYYLCHECLPQIKTKWSKISSQILLITIDVFWSGSYCSSCGFWPAYISIPTRCYDEIVLAKLASKSGTAATKLASLVQAILAYLTRPLTND